MSFLHSGRRARPMQALRLNKIRAQPLATSLHAAGPWRLLMRQVPIWILAVGVALNACDRAGAASNANNPEVTTAAPAAAETASPPADSAARTAPVAAVHEVTLPAGTRLTVVLDTSVGSVTSRVEQPVQAHISRAV